jgi:hypothetical protein
MQRISLVVRITSVHLLYNLIERGAVGYVVIQCSFRCLVRTVVGVGVGVAVAVVAQDRPIQGDFHNANRWE